MRHPGPSMDESLEAVIARAIYDAPNGIDGDQLADMLIEDDRINGATADECRAQIMAVCTHAARAAFAAIEAAAPGDLLEQCSEIEPTFLLNCRVAVQTMRQAGINETLIATIVQDIRSATLNEEYRRLYQLVLQHPPQHHRFGDMQDAIAEWLAPDVS